LISTSSCSRTAAVTHPHTHTRQRWGQRPRSTLVVWDRHKRGLGGVTMH
jgi:hypothetical protein